MTLFSRRSFIYYIVSLVLILGMSLPVFGQSVEGKGLVRFGLFIGSNDGGDERVTLAYAETDAESMAEVMTDMGGIERRNSRLLVDPDKAELNNTFAVMRDQIAEAKIDARRVEFLVYYSGHSDEQGLMLGDEHYGYRELRDNITSMDSDVNIAILDSCSSGAFTRLKGGTRQSPFLMDESVNTKGHAFLTSSSEDEAAQESDSIGGSFFTHYLVSALRGAADSTRDGMVTLNEAYTYSFGETLSRTSTTLAGPQHASHEIALTGSGDLILTDLRVANAGIVLDEEIRGRMFISDRGGRIVAEVRKESGIPLTIALPAGRYTVTLDNDESLLSASIAVSGSGKVDLAIHQFDTVEVETTTSRGGLDDSRESQTEPDEITSVAELTGEILEDIMHIGTLLTFIPTLDETKAVIDNLSVKLFGETYRIQGVDIGLLNLVTEDVRGTQVAGVGNVVGNEVHGAQVGGVFSITEGDVQGAQVSGVLNITNGDVRGGQAAGVLNIAEGDVKGGQGAGVFNIAGGSVQWFQGAGVFNIADSGQMGFQGAGVFNILGDDVRGFQGAGVFNIAEGAVHGFQAGGVFNIAEGQVNGFQGSGVANIAGDGINGFQATGVVNVGETINGGQIGLINVGGAVHGVQVGLINISKAMYGFPIGLINISGNGLYDPSVWSDDRGYTYAGYQLGAGAFYSLIYAGGPYKDPFSNFALGAGLGIHADFNPFYLDMDISVKSIGSGADLTAAVVSSAVRYADLWNAAFNGGDYPMTVYPMARITAGFTLFRRVSVFAGLGLEGHVPDHTEKSEYFHSGNPWIVTSPDSALGFVSEVYPRWYVGIRI